MYRPMFGRRSRSSENGAFAYVVSIGTGMTDDTLTVAAVTGSVAEAEVLLKKAVEVFPMRSSSWEQVNFVASSPPSQRSLSIRPAAIGPGERRTVHVVNARWLDADDESIEIFDGPRTPNRNA